MIERPQLTEAQKEHLEEQLVKRGLIRLDGSPIKCPCGCIHLKEVMAHEEVGYACESFVVCSDCGRNLAHRWYGSYDLMYENYMGFMPETNGPSRSNEI